MTTLTYDVAHGRMSALAADTMAYARDRNESTTRLQLIDRLLFDCLGWNKNQTTVEGYERGDYADYILNDVARRLIVEAKREGLAFELPDGLEPIVRLNALHGLSGDITATLEQVERYAQKRGAPYAAICNGHQLVAFVASRADGVSPREGRALVFSSPQEMVDRFPEMWETLTENGCATLRLTQKLRGAVAAPPPKLAEQIHDYPGTAPTSDRATILGTLGVLFRSDYERDNAEEDDYLRECYCPPGAYSQLALLNRGVLRTRLSTALGQELRVGLEEARTKDGLNQHLVDEVAITSAGREPLVLLGSLGVGKTMFLRRLLRIDAKELAKEALVLYVDLGRGAVIENLKSYVALSLREQLRGRYGIDVDSNDFLRGTYHHEVRRFATGVNAELKELDINEFKKREIDHLRELASHPESHLGRSLTHLVKLRRPASHSRPR